MKTRCKNEKKALFVGTLNDDDTTMNINSYLENYQQEDGSIIVPDVLKLYMNNLEKSQTIKVVLIIHIVKNPHKLR